MFLFMQIIKTSYSAFDAFDDTNFEIESYIYIIYIFMHFNTPNIISYMITFYLLKYLFIFYVIIL